MPFGIIDINLNFAYGANRIRTYVKIYLSDLQSNAFNHSATSPKTYYSIKYLTGLKGFEPLVFVSKTKALPFGYSPI